MVEQRATLMAAASLWNDGKIHLGYTFTGTSSLATARLMQEGAGVFVDTLERVTGQALDDSVWGNPVTYIVDPASLFDADTLWLRANAVAALIIESSTRLPGLRRYADRRPVLERLGPDQASAETRQDGIVAAWRTTERHVAAREVAARVRGAVAARGIVVVRGRVDAVEPADTGWRVRLDRGAVISARAVVNCLWESRALIDRQVVPSSTPVSIRYKLGLYGQDTGLGEVRGSTRILGRFGDVATYANGDAYLSWYPAALAARSDDGVPPEIPPLDRERVIGDTLRGLGLETSILANPGARWEVGGGYVVAHGYGDIDRIRSPLHERRHPGAVELRPGYVSVDTGKYTLGPLLAMRAADLVLRARDRGPRGLVSGEALAGRRGI
jgi:hypothetical protein